MNRYDFSPLFRSTVGFDRMMNMLESAPNVAEATGYPPYNIEKLDEDSYQITMAVAGFSEDDIDIESREDVLFVSGKVKETETGSHYLHRGIAGRSFKRSFQLADHVKVTGAQSGERSASRRSQARDPRREKATQNRGAIVRWQEGRRQTGRRDRQGSRVTLYRVVKESVGPNARRSFAFDGRK